MSNRRRKTRMPGITSLGLAAAAWALALLAGPTLAAVAQLAEDPGNGRLAPRQSDQYAMPATCKSVEPDGRAARRLCPLRPTAHLALPSPRLPRLLLLLPLLLWYV